LNYPIVFAHRGANSFAPENSIPAFEKAIELGCEGIELDVRLATSGEIFVFHDRNTFRMTGVRSGVSRLDYSTLKGMRLFEPLKQEAKIPLLEEVLDLAGKKVLINLDVKKEVFSKDTLEEKLVNILNDFGLRENIIISSFNPLVLKKIALLDPGFHLGFIFHNRTSMMFLNGQPVRSLHARHRILSNKYIRKLYQRSGKIYAWTVDEQDKMNELIEKGIDGIITNKPEIFMELKKSKLAKDSVSLRPVSTSTTINS
jgi:glycerophosphoryl diester phosphodiesterase